MYGGQSLASPPMNMGMQAECRAAQPSLQGTSEVVLQASERVAGRILLILARLDGQPIGPGNGDKRPSMSILQQMGTAHDNLNIAEKMLGELEGKVFG